jgi:hypothetical protein
VTHKSPQLAGFFVTKFKAKKSPVIPGFYSKANYLVAEASAALSVALGRITFLTVARSAW